MLSPIDRETWYTIGKTSKLSESSKVVELASGKGAFAKCTAETFRCKVDAYEINSKFVEFAKQNAEQASFGNRVRFTSVNVNKLKVEPNVYDLGVCLGALYIFRDTGWKILEQAVKLGGYLAISEMYAKKLPVPASIMKIFFEESDKPWTREDTRRWYLDHGVEIVREEECSRKAWLEYYDLTKEMLLGLKKKYRLDRKIQAEIAEGLEEDRLVRKYGDKYLGYVTLIMRKTR